ncbi:MAG TPA: hypothetical protein VGY97_01665, partial [Solirubrobacteraceae bacterium]|nr:hypothetical protein [Solirubrobacteraceae bacterium]
MKAEGIADRAASDRALVFGSLPGQGRDLDLLVRSPEHGAIGEALARGGFERERDEWVRFAECSVEVVELVPAARWHLPDAELGALFDDAVAIDGFERLVRPAAHHALLILARRLAGGDGRLDAKRRARLETVLRDDASAWEAAGRRADAWGAGLALEQLRRVHGTGVPAPRTARARAVAEYAARAGASPLRTVLTVGRLQIPRRARGHVIAISGLDGAGKSSQAQALAGTLDMLGYESATAWTRITYEGWVWRLAWPAKRALTRPLAQLQRWARRPGGAAGPESRAGDAGPPGPASRAGDSGPVSSDAGMSSDPSLSTDFDPVKRLRQRSRLLTELWTGVIALANGISQRRLTRSELRRGRVVVCDRYTLDSVVALRFLYGESRPFALQRRLIGLLSPKPTRAYLLDVS